MNDILTTINLLWPLLGVVAVVISGAVLWKLSQRFTTKEEHTALVKRLDAQEKAMESVSSVLAELNTRLAAMPNSESLYHISLSLEEVRGGQREMAARLQGQADVLARIERPLNLLTEIHLKEKS